MTHAPARIQKARFMYVTSCVERECRWSGGGACARQSPTISYAARVGSFLPSLRIFLVALEQMRENASSMEPAGSGITRIVASGTDETRSLSVPTMSRDGSEA